MKKLFFLNALLVLFAFSCTNSTEASDTTTTDPQMEEAATTPADTEAEATTDEQGPEYTSAYICPMHCPGSGSAEPGSCPACGMDYIANTEMDHDDHEGHQH